MDNSIAQVNGIRWERIPWRVEAQGIASSVGGGGLSIARSLRSLAFFFLYVVMCHSLCEWVGSLRDGGVVSLSQSTRFPRRTSSVQCEYKGWECLWLLRSACRSSGPRAHLYRGVALPLSPRIPPCGIGYRYHIPYMTPEGSPDPSGVIHKGPPANPNMALRAC